MTQKRVAIAGSSGSIGTQTLDVIAQSPDKFEVVALGVGSSVDVVVEQAKRWKPRVVVVTDEAARSTVAAMLPGVHVSSDLTDVVDDADVVVNGVVGFAGLPVTLATLAGGKRLALFPNYWNQRREPYKLPYKQEMPMRNRMKLPIPHIRWY